MSEVLGYRPDQEKVSVINRAEMEPLTAYDEEFFIPHVAEGEDVLIGRGFADGDCYLRCDFSAFAEKLKAITPEELEELFEAVGKLEQQAPDQSEDKRRLLNACWRTARIVRNLLGDPGSEFQRKQSFIEYATQTAEGKKVCIKPLSKSKGLAVCSEYSLLAHHVLEKLGIQSSIVVGAFTNDVEDPLADRHTFLVLENGNHVFDPTHTLVQKDGWPPKVFTPETPLTVENLKNMETDDSESFGRKIICTDLLTKEKKVYGTGAI